MDWQQAASLLVVGVTAILMARSFFRKRGACGQENAACGCGGGPPASTFKLRARKGERPVMHVKL